MSKPFPSAVVPRHPTRLALAVAAAPAGLTLTSTHTLAQGSGAAFGTCVTSGNPCASATRVMTAAFCWAAAFVATIGLVRLWKTGFRRANPPVLACFLLVVLVVTGTVSWVALIAPDPGLPAVRFE